MRTRSASATPIDAMAKGKWESFLFFSQLVEEISAKYEFPAMNKKETLQTWKLKMNQRQKIKKRRALQGGRASTGRVV